MNLIFGGHVPVCMELPNRLLALCCENLILPLTKNLLGLKRKANRLIFAFYTTGPSGC